MLRGLLLSSIVPPLWITRQWDMFFRGMLDRPGKGIPAEERPEDLPRMEICLNGDWETVENVTDEAVPQGEWVVRRAPAMPLVGDSPITSAWYRHKMSIPDSWRKSDRQYFLRLEKAGHYAAIYWNGQQVGEHYGQYTPFEADLTKALRAGQLNEIAIYVHNASGKYARSGVVLADAMEGNAYRGATIKEYQRNWTGIVGDISLGWRPAGHISEVFVVPSVRKRRLSAELKVECASADASGLTVRAVVLDDGKVICQLPEKTVFGGEPIRIEADWADPVLWGPEPYGKPKLYVLRTELLKHGRLVDRCFTRFGFREVWIEGRNVLLNGKKLWMAGTYFDKLASLRYLNDRHPQSLMIEIMQKSGLNTLHGHWDELGDTWLDQCDEMGMLVVGGFFCDGRPDIQSRADPGWEDWMATTCREWVQSARNHPSIVTWRPTDVIPKNLTDASGFSTGFSARLANEIRREDRTRPISDGSDIEAWSQSSLSNEIGQFPKGKSNGYDDGTQMALALAASRKPFLTKEIWTSFPPDPHDQEGLSWFFEAFYGKAFGGGGTGMIVQHLPLIEWSHAFQVSWLSASGNGNRDIGSGVEESNLPNWCDPSQPIWTDGPYNDLFARLYRKWMKLPAPVYRGKMPGEVLVSGLEAEGIVFLVPEDRETQGARGMRVARDGSIWMVGLRPAAYRLSARGKMTVIRVVPQALAEHATYSDVQRVNASGADSAVEGK